MTDHQGSVRNLFTDAAGRVEHIRYSAFGQMVEVRNGSTVDPTNTPTIVYAYTGREFDADTGLQYNRRRWYDPATGRWMSQDPIGFEGGVGDGLSHWQRSQHESTSPTADDRWQGAGAVP